MVRASILAPVIASTAISVACNASTIYEYQGSVIFEPSNPRSRGTITGFVEFFIEPTAGETLTSADVESFLFNFLGPEGTIHDSMGKGQQTYVFDHSVPPNIADWNIRIEVDGQHSCSPGFPDRLRVIIHPGGDMFRVCNVCMWPCLTWSSSQPGSWTLQPIPGDFNDNRVLDANDIDLLSRAIMTPTPDLVFDLNDDGQVNSADRTIWVHDIRGTYFGDADLDGEFNSSDLVSVLHAGLYYTADPAVWQTGDWDGSGYFDSSDIVAAFIDGGYEKGPRTDVAAVPESSGWLLVALGAALLLCVLRRSV